MPPRRAAAPVRGAFAAGRGRGRGRGRGQGQDLPPPPPANPTMAQVMFQQTQILQALLSNQQTGPAGRHSKLADFLRTRPLTFAAANEPLEAEDWLRDTEKKLRLARCSDKDKVDFATHQLKGAAAAWWENYLALLEVMTI